MRTIAIMPIKLINERCPGKNTRLLGGLPLLQYELNSLIQTEMCDEIHVYCSDERIVSFVPKGVLFTKRPDYLDLPTSNFTQIFECFMNEINADIYVYAHATAPFVKRETMEQCIMAVKSGKYDSAFCAIKLQEYLWMDGEPLNFNASNIPRTQDLPPVFQETSGVYVFTKEVFQKHKRRIGVKPFIKTVSFKESIDIDTPEDFLLAENFLHLDEF